MYNRSEEIYEAIYAGERALDSLQQAQKELQSAGNWGIADILGGNIVSGMMKHASLNKASQYIEEAKDDLHRFRYELGDIHDINDMHIDVNGFLTFADFFFDGFISDFLVQSRIDEGRRQVREAIYRINSILDQLEKEVR